MKFYIQSPLVFLCFICSILFLSSCGKDSDLFEIISEEQVDESEEILDSQNEEEDREDEGNNVEDTDSAIGGDNQKLNIIFDTDANNELDDQHALAYLLSNGDLFNLEAITVNATHLGGDIDGHFEEALRVLKLYNLEDRMDIFKGANGAFEDIEQNWNPNNFDGIEAADILIEKTREKETLIVAVGKLTNVALALRKDPELANRSKVIWLGSNYPNKGEYNETNDLSAVNYVIESGIPFEIVTVRLGSSMGSAFVRVNVDEINDRMPGLGPETMEPVPGRHGGQFRHFGDYSISLFENIGKDTRSLFDLVALSILKNPEWGTQESIPAPILVNGNWVDRPENNREITIWGGFNRDAILEDFFESLENYSLVE
ncbi:nucleoside hydrolase [Maribacter sp. 2304DJ31-5]|uniref:nucleoside hydrolase n=1 Tax=Maribacter sp. 2304DJ31-5 TaxID=3386273 RepID=UPI0039BD0971